MDKIGIHVQICGSPKIMFFQKAMLPVPKMKILWVLREKNPIYVNHHSFPVKVNIHLCPWESGYIKPVKDIWQLPEDSSPVLVLCLLHKQGQIFQFLSPPSPTPPFSHVLTQNIYKSFITIKKSYIYILKCETTWDICVMT